MIVPQVPSVTPSTFGDIAGAASTILRTITDASRYRGAELKPKYAKRKMIPTLL
jgi:hypothetical protein